MRKNCVLIYIVVLLLLVSGCSGETVSVEKGEPVFGSFATTDLSGNPVDQQVFTARKLTMVNIWATFCSPCIKEMPELAQLEEEFSDAFQIIGIVADAADKNGNAIANKKAEALSIIETTGADYLHLLPSVSLNKAYLNNVNAVPETVFVDENGNQVGTRYIGAKTKAQWREIIVSLLESLA